MGHEKSITIKQNGKYVNLSTEGGKVSPKKAARQYSKGKRKALGGKTYKSKDKAVDAAKKRSKRHGRSHKRKGK